LRLLRKVYWSEPTKLSSPLYLMDNLELNWQTFEFHSANIMELEEKYEKNLKKTNILLRKQVPATKWEKLEMRNKMISLCNKLISSYGKHIDCINDLIALYKYNEINGIPIPEERNADIQLFNELKSVSATLAEEMRVYKQKLSNLLS
jgi:hypothetical protein